jgi:hypothetical protein
MSSSRRYVDQDTTAILDGYIDELCADQDFLCSNKKLCADNSSRFGTLQNINTTCENIKQAKKCPGIDVDVCLVRADNFITKTQKYANTTFMNIIVPISGAVDNSGNQKFLRLPPLSGSKIPGGTDLCNSCACFERFAVAPGTGAGLDSQYTAPGQGECVFPPEFEYYYYPLDIENINNTLKDEPEIFLGNYKVLPENIIYANNNQDLVVENLYDILLRYGISSNTAYNFITRKLWPNDTSKEIQLKLHIKNKQGMLKMEHDNKKFSNDIVSFYVIFIVFIILIIFNLNKSV